MDELMQARLRKLAKDLDAYEQAINEAEEALTVAERVLKEELCRRMEGKQGWQEFLAACSLD